MQIKKSSYIFMNMVVIYAFHLHTKNIEQLAHYFSKGREEVVVLL